MELRGRLPGCTALATGRPSRVGSKLKSVSWLLRIKPSAITRAPKLSSTDEVKLTALPSRSMMLRWVVDSNSICGSGVAMPLCIGSLPGVTFKSCCRRGFAANAC